MAVIAPFQRGLDSIYARIGVAVTYTPLAGSASAPVAVLSFESEDRPDGLNNQVTDKTPVASIRRSEVDLPKKGDRIATSGGDTYQVVSVREQSDIETKLNLMVVR